MSAPICHYYFEEWDCKLLAPLSMVRRPMDEILDATNGCGREGKIDEHVPDTIWGLDVSFACRVHDWMYEESDTKEEEQYADAIFAANLVSLIQQHTKSKIIMWLRLRRAYKYISAVTITDCIDVATLEILGIKELVC